MVGREGQEPDLERGESGRSTASTKVPLSPVSGFTSATLPVEYPEEDISEYQALPKPMRGVQILTDIYQTMWPATQVALAGSSTPESGCSSRPARDKQLCA